jgi:hypothetical protein
MPAAVLHAASCCAAFLIPSECLQVDVARGARGAAKRQYERLLGKALRGYGPSEHWAHAEYAELLAADGDYAAAAKHLGMAIDVASMPDGGAEPGDLARYYFQLGQVLFERTDAEPCALACMGCALQHGILNMMRALSLARSSRRPGHTACSTFAAFNATQWLNRLQGGPRGCVRALPACRLP